MKKEKPITFEEGMERVESLVDALEKGSMTLEESFVACEQAAALLKRLGEMLDEGEKRVALLTQSGEEPMQRDDLC